MDEVIIVYSSGEVQQALIPTASHHLCAMYNTHNIIIESVDSISRDERDVPLMQYITNA